MTGFAGTLDEEEEEVDKTKKRRSTKKHSDEVGGAEYYYCEVLRTSTYSLYIYYVYVPVRLTYRVWIS